MAAQAVPRRRQSVRSRQAGAALLLALVAVTLIVTLAAGMVWQQQRAIQVEAAERARSQSGWILLGALDWSRLILREDGRTSNVDHAGEPWATPLAEARLSTFLAAGKDGVAEDEGPEAFLAGAIEDAQSRYNLRNLMAPDGKAYELELATLSRLCATAGLPPDAATRLARALRTAWRVTAATAPTEERNRPVAIRRLEQLAWLDIEPGVISALQASTDILPSPTPVNVNTAPREVLAAVLDVDLGVAERLVQQRQRSPYRNLEQLTPLLPEGTKLDPQRVAIATSHFLVSGRLRLEDRVLEERSLVTRRGTGNGVEVLTLHRERRSLDLNLP
ncbi:MAG: type II secretion system minor pseudopilin GspK [Rubrivivax sp.]|jgi:general secretion pathway protein K|nr:type II secretion system minor pseudopilin GspK [Rubrivivax sp.]